MRVDGLKGALLWVPRWPYWKQSATVTDTPLKWNQLKSDI